MISLKDGAGIGNAIAAMILLGLSVGLMGRYFRSISGEYTTLIIYASGIGFTVPLVFGLAKLDALKLVAPTGLLPILGIAVCGVMIAFADYFGMKAFNSGASTALVAGVIAAAPAISVFVDFALGGPRPEARAFGGIILVILGVALVRGGVPQEHGPASEGTPAPVVEEQTPTQEKKAE